MKMNTFLAFWGALAILVIALASPLRAAEEFKVGDAQGWRQPTANETEMYNQWIEGKKLHIGDSVRFEYKNDSVLVVDKWGYYHCEITEPTSVFNDGNTTITLDNPGPIYFISGDPDHCEDGQRLLIDVIPLIPESPPAIASPPQPYPELSPAPSPLSSSGASISITTVVLASVAFVTLMSAVFLLPWTFIQLGLF